MQPDGRILFTNGEFVGCALENGTVDPTWTVVNWPNAHALQYHASGRVTFVGSSLYRIQYREADGTAVAGTVSGYVNTSPYLTEIFGAVQREDGSLLVHGIKNLFVTYPEAALVNVLPTCQVDTTFAWGGWGTYHGYDLSTVPVSTQVDDQGRMTIAGPGFGLSAPHTEDMWTVRLNTSGDLDTTFGHFGIVRPVQSPLHALVMNSDGAITRIHHGYTSGGGFDYWVESRRYDINGVPLLPLTSLSVTDDDEFFNWAIGTPDGGTLVLMSALVDSYDLCYSFITKLNTANELDATFANNGIWTDPGGSGTNLGSRLGLFPNGDVLVVQTDPNDAQSQEIALQLRRLDANGQPVKSWGNNGVRYLPVVNSTYPLGIRPLDVKMDLGGGFLLLYMAYSQSLTEQRSITRFNAQGNVDASFGNNGHVSAPELYSSSYDRFDDQFLLLPDGKALITENEVIESVTLRRRLSNGANDTGFGTNGTLLVGGPDPLGVSGVKLDVDSAGRVRVTGNVKRPGHDQAPYDLFVFILSDELSTGTQHPDGSSTNTAAMAFPKSSQGSTLVSYHLARTGKVDISLCDGRGRCIAQVLHAERGAGDHQQLVQWPDGLALGT